MRVLGTILNVFGCYIYGYLNVIYTVLAISRVYIFKYVSRGSKTQELSVKCEDDGSEDITGGSHAQSIYNPDY